MKKTIVLIIFLFGFNLSYAKECVYKRSTQTGESKYTEQYSIKTNISGHILRIFTLVVNPKASKKNCDGLKVKESVFWGMSNYVNKNGTVKYMDTEKIGWCLVKLGCGRTIKTNKFRLKIFKNR